MLADIIEKLIGRVEEDEIACLTGFAAVLVARWDKRLPPAAFRTEDGLPVYTVDQYAEIMGISIEEARKSVGAMRDSPDTEKFDVADNPIFAVN